jgi:hypothetical protein
MTVIKAHFDGRVLVPDEPVELPVNQPLRVYVEPTPVEDSPLLRLAHRLSEMPDNPSTPSDLAARHDHYLYGMPKRP